MVAGQGSNSSVSVVFTRHASTNHFLDSTEVSGIERNRSPTLHLHRIDVGEVPPPAPRFCYGRDKLVRQIISLARDLVPFALIGPGGIGKTSIALTVLHHDRIKERFGNNRRFIRCDKFTASRANFLRRLSQVTGAGVENPEDLTPLRRSLTSNEMLIVLDNAESILDPQGAGGWEINAVVEELSKFRNICLCITFRITTVPPDCKALIIPTLSVEAARKAFYRVYRHDRESDSVNNILKQLDFHPLSVTLLATFANQSLWDGNRLVKEWKRRQTDVLRTGYNESLASTIELSLTSPTFRNLGPDARGLLRVVAFLPQVIDEKNFDWLFHTIPNRTTIFDTFCVLSLTYRDNGFITMLAPLRDYLCPRDPMSSPLLCATKDHYFTRVSVEIDPDRPSFRESRWIVSEDVNTEYLVDIFTSIDSNSRGVWLACDHFVNHLCHHKPRHTVLIQKIQDLPDDHLFKIDCTLELTRLLRSLGNFVESKQLLDHTLTLRRKKGDGNRVAWILEQLCEANMMLGFYKAGIEQAREALEIRQRLGTKVRQIECLRCLANLLRADGQLDAAKGTASHGLNLLPKKGYEHTVHEFHHLLDIICSSKGERGEAVYHLEAALAIAFKFRWHDGLFWVHRSLTILFLDGGEFDRAQHYAQQAKLHVVDNPYNLGCAMLQQAEVWYHQCRLKEAKSEASCASKTFEGIGASMALKNCENLLHQIEREKSQITSDK